MNDVCFSDVSLSVSGNKIMVLSGDSGIGKTTFIRLAACLLVPDFGFVQSEKPFSFLFQDDRLLPWHTVAGNCALPLLASGTGKPISYAHSLSLLSNVGLEDAMDKFPDELSGGMKRRVCLARCFARNPKALFLDEPFNGLQKKARMQLWQVFLELWGKNPCPAIIVTHYPEEIPSGKQFLFYSISGHPARLEKMRPKRYNH
ncbi:MAG: ATP-binding cassette domain-containing protein [Spirochaetaceae bacterium]|nr:MAG: ATP-binding cassette domain-containing protein [Spirochaetaceae bacterium]